jgi:nucleoside-diphosphate-sugar epimerase
MRKVLVTGATGFLGGYVCAELRRRAFHVTTLGREDRGSGSVPLPRLVSRASLATVLRDIEPSIIFHLAGTSQSADLGRLYDANVVYAASLLDAALDCRIVPVVVVIGSAAEYGTPLHPGGVTRETDLCLPLSAYGISKLAQTNHALASFKRGVPTIAARLFNPIGVGSPPTTALGSFVNQIAGFRDGGVLQTGDLGAIRDFVDVRDAARAIVDLAMSEAAFGKIVNLCSGLGSSLAEIVERLMRLSGVSVQHLVDPQRGGTSDVPSVIGENERLKSLGVAISPPNIDRILLDMLEAARGR